MDITEKDILEAHKLGLKVVVWGWPEMEKTENNYKQIEKMIDCGIDGIIAKRL
jgi:glycerophosphoryl diester phosphodiesterase